MSNSVRPYGQKPTKFFCPWDSLGKNTGVMYFCFIDYAKAFDRVDHKKLWKILRDGNTRPPNLPLEKSVCRSGSKLELDMEQQTGSK